MVKDCLRFTMHFFHLIQQSASHIYHSALPLSPKSSIFLPMSLPEKTRIAEFDGRPENWGFVVRTITGTHGGFTCVTAIGRGGATKIAAACDDGTVRIYDSVTGVLRLSLSPPHSIQSMIGSPDGSILFCTHRESCSITLWDIQTGGLVHTFTLETEARDTAISLDGRYLACGLPNGTVKVWEVSSRKERPAFESGSSITCLCWLAPEERLMFANEMSIHIRDVVTGSVLVHSFEMQDLVCGATYSQKFNQLAVVTGSGIETSITIIDAQTGAFSASCRFQRRLSCFAFSQTTPELVCGMEARGLESISVSPWHRKCHDFPATVTSVLTLSNGTVVANLADSGIQLLILDEGYTPPQQVVPPALTVRPLDEGKIVTIVPTDRDRVILLEVATMSEVFTIPAQGGLLIPIDRTVIICASLENKIAVYCLAEGHNVMLQLWKPAYTYPQCTVRVDEQTHVCGISPTGTRLVTLHAASAEIHVRVWDARNGSLLAEFLPENPGAPHPLDITVYSEKTFCFHHDTHRILYTVTAELESGGPNRLRICQKLPPSPGRQYRVDDSHEWVVRGSERICWVPPGYIGSVQASHCWAGSSFFMVGQDGTLRSLTFQGSPLDHTYTPANNGTPDHHIQRPPPPSLNIAGYLV